MTAFGNATLSVPGDSLSAFFALLGFGNFGSVSITHDDGATMYVDSYLNAVISAPGETSSDTNTGAAPGGFHSFLVTSVEGNGAPSILQVSIPEPSTWAMIGLGFAALGFAGWRKAKNGQKALFAD